MQAGFPLQDISFSFDIPQFHEREGSPKRPIVRVPASDGKPRRAAHRALDFHDENGAGMKRVHEYADSERQSRKVGTFSQGDIMDIEEQDVEQDIDLDYYTCLEINDTLLLSIARSYSYPIKIVICSCKNISDDAFEQIFEGKSQLQHIELCWCGSGLTDKTLYAISKNCPNLQTLILTLDFTQSKAHFTDDGIIAIFNSCPNLQTLCIEDVPTITGKAFYAVEQKGSNLQELTFLGSPHCREHEFEAMVKGCRSLQRLDISRCANLSDRWLDLLGYYSQNLKILSIGRRSAVSERAIQNILKALPDLAVYEGSSPF